MADIIKFKCKACGKKMGVRPEYAGKKTRCIGCKQAVRVPTPRPKRAASGAPVAAGFSSGDSSSGRGDSGISLADLAAMEHQSPAEMAQMSSKAATRAGGQRIEGGKDCPGCGASLKQEAVICVNCGHNFGSGKQLKTKKDSKLGKALSSVKDAAANAADAEDDGEETPWSSIGAGVVFSVLGIATAFYNYRPESDSDEVSILDEGLIFMYDNIGPLPTGGVVLLVGLFFLAKGFRVIRI